MGATRLTSPQGERSVLAAQYAAGVHPPRRRCPCSCHVHAHSCSFPHVRTRCLAPTPPTSHRSGVYRGHAAPILQLMVLGDVLLSLGSDGQLLRWRVGSYEAPEGAIQLPAHCRPTCMAHPDTYLNKVVVGCDNGQLLLYNFVSGALLYTFNGWGSAVRCIASSPALDVVGVALADGRAALLNLRWV